MTELCSKRDAVAFCRGVTGLKPGGLRCLVAALQSASGPRAHRVLCDCFAVQCKDVREALSGLELDTSVEGQDSANQPEDQGKEDRPNKKQD